MSGSRNGPRSDHRNGRGGRQRAVIDRREIVALAHEGRSLRSMARQLRRSGVQISYGTVRRVYLELLEAGRIDPGQRAAAQRLRPPSKGGRPTTRSRRPRRKDA